MSRRPDVIVVGGGIGGLSAAFALARAGLRVRVLERAREFGEVGAGMQLAPNCTRLLESCGLLGEAVRLGVLPGNMVMRDAPRDTYDYSFTDWIYGPTGAESRRGACAVPRDSAGVGGSPSASSVRARIRPSR